MGVFCISVALIEWSESELNDVKRLCVQAYKSAWHLSKSTASALFIFPKIHVGKESKLPIAVLTQGLLLHAKRCMRHEDVVNPAGRVTPHFRRAIMQLFC